MKPKRKPAQPTPTHTQLSTSNLSPRRINPLPKAAARLSNQGAQHKVNEQPGAEAGQPSNTPPPQPSTLNHQPNPAEKAPSPASPKLSAIRSTTSSRTDSPTRPSSNNSATPANTSKSVTRSEEHTSELQSHSFISYAAFCLK